MKSKLLPAVLCCLAGTCAAEPVRLSDSALDGVTAGTLSWTQLPSAVQQAFQAPLEGVPGAVVFRLPEDARVVISVGLQQFEIDARSIPFSDLAGRFRTLAGDGRTIEIAPLGSLAIPASGALASVGAQGAPGANGSTVVVAGSASASTATLVRVQ